MSAIDDINTAMETAITAQEAGDFRAALSSVRSAWMRICGLPDSEFNNEKLTWSREGLEQLMKELQRLANGQMTDTTQRTIIRPVPILYERG